MKALVVITAPFPRPPVPAFMDARPITWKLAARQENRAVWMSGYYYAPTTATRPRLLLDPGSLPFPSSTARV
jgi:hypothetical protein